MDFSTIFFIWVYLPATLVLIYGISFLVVDKSRRIQISNGVLLILSLWFYSWAGIKATVLMVCIVIINYLCGVWIHRAGDKKRRSRLVTSICFNVLTLAVFKYGNMLIAIAEILKETDDYYSKKLLRELLSPERTGAINIQDITLLLAISFVTFQSISYHVDVYKKKTEPAANLMEFTLYELLFFQLVQGPIIRFGDIRTQISNRTITADKSYDGIRRFCQGLAKKVLIANTLAPVVDGIWGLKLSSIGTIDAWIGIILYAFQIYYDFSGYSDMAIGLGKMLGFEICENFDHPYISESIQEFWRRWHISLSSWFKDYIYIPLGGNRKGQRRTLVNLTIVFLITGIWHGADWTFLLWGLWFALIQIIERLLLLKHLKKDGWHVLKRLYAFLIVVIGWVLFRAPDIFKAIDYYKVMFSVSERTSSYGWYSFTDYKFLIAVVAAIAFSGILGRYSERYKRMTNTNTGMVIDAAIHFVLLSLAIIQILSGSYNPSIYAGF